MNLTVRETARLLSTSEATIYRWIEEGSIPAHRIGDQYRFHRTELLEWATTTGKILHPEVFERSRRTEDERPDLRAALSAGGIHHHVGGTDREAVLRAAIDRLPLADPRDRALLFDVLIARERAGSTGIGDGIAIPHVRHPVVLDSVHPSITLCFLDHSVDFDAIDGRPVHTVFLLVTPAVRTHLSLLARLSAALQDDAFRKAVIARAPAETLLDEAARIERKFREAEKAKSA